MSRTPRAAAHPRPASLVAVAAGGVAGTSARYELGLAAPGDSGHWPVTTFMINLGGAFLLGLLLEGLTRLGPDSGWRQRARLLLGAGFLGAFTTYSSLAVEADRLIGVGHPWTGAAYLLASAAGGTAAAAAGVSLAGFAFRRTASRERA